MNAVTDAASLDDAAVIEGDEASDKEAAENATGKNAGANDEAEAKPLGRVAALWDSLANKPLWLAALAGVVTLILAALLFSGSESDKVLYYGLSERDASEVVEQLDKVGIPWRIESGSGNIRVPESSLYDARLKIAAAGLPRGTGQGLDFLNAPPEIGRSQFSEQARYHHGLERELAATISSLGSIEKARVHLALPKKSVFIRERKPPSASVVIYLHPGRVLDDGQVAAITHMISSSVPDLSNDKVTVVDQRGQLLNRRYGDPSVREGFERMDYVQRLENHYIRRIEELLAPIVGAEQIQAQVVAEVDYTQRETSSEAYDPRSGAVRSEQFSEDQSNGPAVGIPGAMANEPPAPTALENRNNLEDDGGAGEQGSKRVRQLRNYELSRTVSHERVQPGAISRLSVAVVVGGRPIEIDPNATEPAKPSEYTTEELDRLTTLVRNAVGYQEARGDTVQVINAQFSRPDAAPPLAWWQEDNVVSLAQIAMGGVIGLFLLLTVVLPLMRLAIPGKDTAAALPGPEQEDVIEGELDEEGNALPGEDSGNLLGGDPIIGDISALLPPGLLESGDYDTYVAAAQMVSAQDPLRTAQVLKRWIHDNV